MSTTFVITAQTSEEAIEDILREYPFKLEENMDSSGNTPLMIACYLGNVGVVQYLLSLGANVQAKNNVIGNMNDLASTGCTVKCDNTFLNSLSPFQCVGWLEVIRVVKIV